MKKNNSSAFVSSAFTGIAMALGLGFVAFSTTHAQVPLPLYEPVPAAYTNGTADETVPVPAGGVTFPARRLANGITTAVWPLSVGGGLGNGNVVAVGGAAGLSYPGLYQSPDSIGLYIRTNATTANRTRGILFPIINSGTIYASFLMNVQQLPAANRLFVKFETATSGTGSSGGNGAMAGIWLTPAGELGISKSSTSVVGATDTTPLSSGTHLMVARYTWNPDAGDDEVALWIDPGSLNVPEASIPLPTLTFATGTDIPSISTLYIHHPQSGGVPAGIFLDELRIATTWADVTSTQALCTTASIVTSPANRTVNEGVAGRFSIVAGGSAPAFQWQVSTTGGASWSSVNGGVGGTSQNYQTPPTTPANHGDQYRVITTVTCGNGSSVTSAPATLTVNAAVVTPVGVVVDDVFQDFLYNNLPYDISNSVWFASAASSLDASSGTAMMGIVPPGSAVLWIGHFTDDSITNLPVHLAVGRALKGRLVFKATNIVGNNGNLRFGLFDYADGSARVISDGFGGGSTGNGTNVLGYMTTVNFGTTFTGNPMSLFARNNLVSSDLMGTTANFLALGGGPANYNGAPAFQNDTQYTIEFTLARKSVASVEYTTRISGGATNWSHTVTDNTYAYPRFDAVAVRAGSAETAASNFEFSRLLVEVVAETPDLVPLAISSSGGNVTLTWTNPAFALQAAPEASGTYTNVTGATSPYSTAAGGAKKFFRLIAN